VRVFDFGFLGPAGFGVARVFCRACAGGRACVSALSIPGHVFSVCENSQIGLFFSM